MKSEKIKFIIFVFIYFSLSKYASALEFSAHAGDSKAAPPNSIPAFLSAVKKGADYIEIDVWLTKSGKLICQHDTNTTYKLSGCAKELCDYTDADLANVNIAGGEYAKLRTVRIPTLEEVLKKLPKKTKIEIDCKAANPIYYEKIRELFDKIGFDEKRVVFNTGHSKIVKRIFPKSRAQSDLLLLQEGKSMYRVNRWFMSRNNIPPSVIKTPLDLDKFISEMKLKNADTVALWIANVDTASKEFAEICDKLSAAGFLTNAWTVNDVSVAKKLPQSLTTITTDNLLEMSKAFKR